MRLLLGLYGEGLSHIMDVLAAEREAGGAVRDRLLADPVVESLLLLHDLHPLDVDARIQRALDRVRPYLGSHAGGVEYLGVGADGVARLRLEGSCHGCPSSTVTVQLAIQGAVEDAAPEVTEVVVEGMTDPPEPPLLQIGRRTGPPDSPGSPVAGAGDPGWVSLPGIGPPDGRPTATTAGGIPVRLPRRLRRVRLLARRRDTDRGAARLPGLWCPVRRAGGGQEPGRPAASPGPAPAAERQPRGAGRAPGGCGARPRARG